MKLALTNAAFPDGLDSAGIVGLITIAMEALERSGNPVAAAYAQMALDTYRSPGCSEIDPCYDEMAQLQ